MRSLPDMLQREGTVFQETFSGGKSGEPAFFQSLFSGDGEEAGESPASRELRLTPKEADSLPNMEAFELFSDQEGQALFKEQDAEQPDEAPPPPPEKSEEELRAEAMVREAQDALNQAKKTAEALKRQAISEAEEIRRQAGEQGFSAGRTEGLEAGRQEGRDQIRQELMTRYSILFQAANQAAADLERQKREFAQTYLEDLRDLVVTIAEKVISVSLKSSGKVIEGMMRDAVGARQARRLWANVSISEEDYQGLLENGITPESVLEEAADQVRLTVVEEAEPGTCLIEFPEEIIDASVSTQIANIKKMMKNVGTAP